MRLDQSLRRRFALERFDDGLELARLRVPLLEQSTHDAAQAEMLAVQHLKIEVGIDVAQRDVAQQVRLEIRRARRLRLRHARAHDRRRCRGPHGGALGARAQRGVLRT